MSLDNIVLGQTVFFIAQAVLLVFSAVMSLFLRGAAKKLDDLTSAIRGMEKELARGDQRFTDLERRVAGLEARVREHERDTA
jgi:hypothetical protein